MGSEAEAHLLARGPCQVSKAKLVSSFSRKNTLSPSRDELREDVGVSTPLACVWALGKHTDPGRLGRSEQAQGPTGTHQAEREAKDARMKERKGAGLVPGTPQPVVSPGVNDPGVQERKLFPPGSPHTPPCSGFHSSYRDFPTLIPTVHITVHLALGDMVLEKSPLYHRRAPARTTHQSGHGRAGYRVLSRESIPVIVCAFGGGGQHGSAPTTRCPWGARERLCLSPQWIGRGRE